MTKVMTIQDVKDFIEWRLVDAKSEYVTSVDSVMNIRAQAFGVIMFAQKFLPYDELEAYWEGENGEESVWQKFNDIARGKNR